MGELGEALVLEQCSERVIMSNIKLTYFNLRARGEGPRLILHYAGKKFEDVRITPSFQNPAEWSEVKPNTPWGTVPVLEYDGLVLGQSLTIARFLATEFGLAGNTNLERAQADELVDALNDLGGKAAQLFFAKDQEGMKKHAGETVPTALGKIEKMLVSRGGEYMVGGALTYADLYLFAYIDVLQNKDTLLESLPNIKNLLTKIENLPNIKAYLSTRPETLPI